MNKRQALTALIILDVMALGLDIYRLVTVQKRAEKMVTR